MRRVIFFAAALCAGTAFLPAAAAAQAPADAPPINSSVDRNGVDLVSGQVIHSETVLSIGNPAAGGLTYQRVYTGQHERDNFTGTLNFVSGCAFVSLGDSSDDCNSMAANGATFEDMGGGDYKYTMKDGTVAEFSDDWASLSPTKADGGRVTSITYPNGERLDFYYEIVGTECIGEDPCTNTNIVHRKSVVSNLGWQIKFTQGSPNSAAYAVNMAVDTCDPAAWTCSGLTSKVEPFDTVSTYTVNTSPITIVTITRPSGASILYLHDSNGRVTSVNYKTPGGTIYATWDYSFSDNFTAGTRTAVVTGPMSGTRTVVSKISSGQVLSDKDELNRTTTFQYDASDRLTRITHPEGNYTQFTHDSRGNVTEVRKVAKSGSGLSDIVATATFPSSCDSSNFRICNKPISVTDELGEVTDFTYDAAHGGALTVTRPDPDGAGSAPRPQTRFAYDDLYGRYKNASGTIVAAPTPVHRLIGVSTCATGSAPACVGTGDESVNTIDYGDQSPTVASNLLPVSVAAGAGDQSLTALTAMTYDAMGNVIAVDGPLAGADDTTRFRHDANRRHTGVIGPDPDGAGSLKYRAQRISYNADGFPNVVESGTVNGITDPDWAAFVSLEKIETDYDFLNRPVARRLIANSATHALIQYSYDQRGRLECTSRRMNPAEFASPPAVCALGTEGSHGPDRITRYFFDAADQLTKVTKALGTSAQHDDRTATFTGNGLIATLLDGKGNKTTYEYDGFDRVKKTFYPDAANGTVSSATDFEEYTYHSQTGLLTQTRLRDGLTVSFSHDALGRVTFIDKPAGEKDVTFGYDNMSQMVSAAQTGHTLSFVYDALGRPVSEAGPQGTITRNYDAAGRLTRLTWPDAFYVDYDYDNSGALTAVRENGATSGAGVLATFAFDDLGRRVSVTRGNGVTTDYAYDDASRLQTLTHDLAGTANDQTLTFANNPLGGIVSRTSANSAFDWDSYVAESTTYTVNGLNQATAANTTNFTYDGRGNLTSDGVKTWTYDSANRLTAVSGGGTLAYDPLNRLHEVSDGATATKFLMDGVDVVAEYDAAGTTLLRRYVHGAGMDEPLVWYEGSGTNDRRWLSADERGSVVAVSDGTGGATAVNKYDEFGKPHANNQGRFQYTGQMWLAEVGLYYYKNRIYAPGIGRFPQADPIGYLGGMNLYAYTGNDPVNFTDPLGLCTGSRIKNSDGTCKGTGGYTTGTTGVMQGMARARAMKSLSLGDILVALGWTNNVRTMPSNAFSALGMGSPLLSVSSTMSTYELSSKTDKAAKVIARELFKAHGFIIMTYDSQKQKIADTQVRTLLARRLPNVRRGGVLGLDLNEFKLLYDLSRSRMHVKMDRGRPIQEVLDTVYTLIFRQVGEWVANGDIEVLPST